MTQTSMLEEEVETSGEMIQLEVVGIPYPQGNKSGFVNPKTGKVIMREGGSGEANRKFHTWRDGIIRECVSYLKEHPRPPVDEPIAVVIDFRFPPVASDPYRTRHTTKPDIDKVVRSTFDAMVNGGLLADDSRVCILIVGKRYILDASETAGASISIELLGEAEQSDRGALKAQAAAARSRRR